MNKPYRHGLLAAVFFSACIATAQTIDTGATQTPAPPKVYALVSAVGDVFMIVRHREQVGSNIEPFRRDAMKVPNDGLNAAILRGLDRALAEKEPESKRIYIRLAAAELDDVLPQDRERVAIGKIVAALEKVPERKNWDRIFVVTPKYLMSERRGMASKLHGLGIYIQPLNNNTPGAFDDSESDAEGGGMADETIDPVTGKKSRSSRYIAPFAYTKLWVLDAKTMNIVESADRHDFQKLFDLMATAVDIAKNIPAEKLVERIGSFIERASARALREAVGEVEIGEIKPVKPGAIENKGISK